MIANVEAHREEIGALCREHGVEKLDLFGSAATEDFDPESSDLDFVVSFADKSPGYASRFLAFSESLEEVLEQEVDVVTEQSIENPYFRDALEKNRETVYLRSSEEATL